ncbi:Golgi apparatus membrane protein-like protein ECHIDNA [Citrus sinensis]|nr:Golgi apparatus membrane protein-like protein ECHIDNA [Citrus sinensis]
MDLNQPPGENYANPKTCFFHVLFKGAALAFYILSALFFDSFVIIFVVTVLLAALDFWVVKNVSGRILVGLRWWNEINDMGESVWKFECLDHEAVAWIVLGIFSLIRFQADYLLVVGVCLTLSIANIIGFTKCRKDPTICLPDHRIRIHIYPTVSFQCCLIQLEKLGVRWTSKLARGRYVEKGVVALYKLACMDRLIFELYGKTN